jgi:hypothetical protein
MIQSALRAMSFAALSTIAAASFAPNSAWAQGAPAGKPAVGAGEIVSFDAGKMVVKLKDGSNVTLTVPDNAGVSGLQPIPFADLKKGDYIATAATKQANGTLLAREVRIFPEENRGRGEGYSTNYGGGGADATMTNATVDTITSMDAKTRSFKVKYKDGEQTVVVPENVPLMRTIPADKSLLKPGANITFFANETPNGFAAVRFGVGLNGLKPPV